MRFSLILGTVERTDELRYILSSLNAQTYQDFELIVIDQNPDDRLVHILAPYSDKFPIVHLRSKRGLSRAKNLGLSHVSGDIVGFPDDNCQYPSDLLERVARFFAAHPDIDGLNGRSADEDGRDSNGRYHRESGPIDKYNLWNRSIAYNVFLRASIARNARFDEKLGPGAGTLWGAADEMDYLLQLLDRGASLYYDPDLVAIHPSPIAEVVKRNQELLHRAYTYGNGMGYVLRRYEYPLWVKARWLIRASGAVVLFGVRGRTVEAAYYWNAFKGRLKGLL